MSQLSNDGSTGRSSRESPSERAQALEGLAEHRSRIDWLDARLIELLAERFEVTDLVGILKAEHNLPAVDQRRVDQQMERIARIATANGVDPELAKNILQLIVDKAASNHSRIAGAAESVDIELSKHSFSPREGN